MQWLNYEYGNCQKGRLGSSKAINVGTFTCKYWGSPGKEDPGQGLEMLSLASALGRHLDNQVAAYVEILAEPVAHHFVCGDDSKA